MGDDLDDLRQDLLLDVIARLRSFDPDRGSLGAFAGTVMGAASIALASGATVNGQLLATTGAVTLEDGVIADPSASRTPTQTPTPPLARLRSTGGSARSDRARRSPEGGGSGSGRGGSLPRRRG